MSSVWPACYLALGPVLGCIFVLLVRMLWALSRLFTHVVSHMECWSASCGSVLVAIIYASILAVGSSFRVMFGPVCVVVLHLLLLLMMSCIAFYGAIILL
jgi:hypothetical protein